MAVTPGVLDMQQIVLPAAFATQTLVSIQLIDDGATDVQRTILDGVTVEGPGTPNVVADRAHVALTVPATAPTVTGNVLSLDTDPIAGDTLHVSAVSFNGQADEVGQAIKTSFGSLILNKDGSFSYTANANDVLPASGTVSGIAEDVFTYTATTGQGGSASSTLTVTVTLAGSSYTSEPAGATVTAPSHLSVPPTLDGSGRHPDRRQWLRYLRVLGQLRCQHTITNYNASKDLIEVDHNQFPSNHQFTSLQVLQQATHQVGSDVVIADQAGAITLHNIQLSHMHFDANHFLLG
jgi:VCBS repeat-containing protein